MANWLSDCQGISHFNLLRQNLATDESGNAGKRHSRRINTDFIVRFFRKDRCGVLTTDVLVWPDNCRKKEYVKIEKVVFCSFCLRLCTIEQHGPRTRSVLLYVMYRCIFKSNICNCSVSHAFKCLVLLKEEKGKFKQFRFMCLLTQCRSPTIIL